MDTQIIGLIAGYMVIEAAKAFIPALQKTKALSSEEAAMLRQIYNIHSRTDDDGRPLVYIPKNISENLIKLSESMKDLSHNQERIAEVLKSLAEQISRNP